MTFDPNSNVYFVSKFLLLILPRSEKVLLLDCANPHPSGLPAAEIDGKGKMFSHIYQYGICTNVIPWP